VTKALRYVWHKLHSVETRVTRLTKTVAVAGVGAVPRAVPNLRKLIREALRDMGRLWAFPKRLGWLLALGTLGALTAAILKKAGLRWLKCHKVGKVGRRVCSMDWSQVNALLADVAFFGTSLSLVAFARELAEVEHTYTGPIIGFLREHDWPGALEDYLTDVKPPALETIGGRLTDYLD
jgi:hypothetical protein